MSGWNIDQEQEAFYNHEGKILYGRHWPIPPPVMSSIYRDEASYQAYKRKMEFLLRYPVPVVNPELLPAIKEGEFLSSIPYNVKFNNNSVTITN